jgi:hypothetical protein
LEKWQYPTVTQKIKVFCQQAVWQNGGFSVFLEAKVLNQSSGIFSNFVLKIRHFAKLLDVMHYYFGTYYEQHITKI